MRTLILVYSTLCILAGLDILSASFQTPTLSIRYGLAVAEEMPADESLSDPDQETGQPSISSYESSPQSFESDCGWKGLDLCACVGYTLGKGVGYTTGYTSIGLFATNWMPDRKINPFADIRVHVLNSGEKAGNVGVGARYYNSCLNQVFGLNLYYDYREGSLTNFNQTGIGAEVLGCCCDFRINGYIPIGNRNGIRKRLFDHYIGDYFAICEQRERSLLGFDAELGCCLKKKNACCPCDFGLYGAIGTYYFAAFCGSDAFGGLLRLEASWLNCINVEVIATSDRVYRERVQGRFELCFPLGGGCGVCDNDYNDCCCRPVRREIIAIGNSCKWHTNFDTGSGSSSCGNCNY